MRVTRAFMIGHDMEREREREQKRERGWAPLYIVAEGGVWGHTHTHKQESSADTMHLAVLKYRRVAHDVMIGHDMMRERERKNKNVREDGHLCILQPRVVFGDTHTLLNTHERRHTRTHAHTLNLPRALSLSLYLACARTHMHACTHTQHPNNAN